MSFSPEQVARSIRRFYPDFQMRCRPDHRQEIAKHWPRAVDDSMAQEDWDWNPKYDLDFMTEDMLDHLARPPKRTLPI